MAVIRVSAYPLIIYLGGGSQRGSDLNRLKTFGAAGLITNGKDFDFIVASLLCPEGKAWTSENDPDKWDGVFKIGIQSYSGANIKS